MNKTEADVVRAAVIAALIGLSLGGFGGYVTGIQQSRYTYQGDGEPWLWRTDNKTGQMRVYAPNGNWKEVGPPAHPEPTGGQ